MISWWWVLIIFPLLLLVAAFLGALGKRPGYRRRRRQQVFEGTERRCPFRETCEKGKTCVLPPSECPVGRATDIKPD